MTFRAFMAENGYNVQTTFWEDFSAADIFGLSAIQVPYGIGVGIESQDMAAL